MAALRPIRPALLRLSESTGWLAAFEVLIARVSSFSTLHDILLPYRRGLIALGGSTHTGGFRAARAFSNSLKTAKQEPHPSCFFPKLQTAKDSIQLGARTIPLYYQYWSPSSQPVELIGPDHPHYRRKVALWRKLPLSVTRLVGPYLSRSLA